MRNQLSITEIQCPYCWQQIEILCDCSIASQSYIEDCQVCCRPIVIDLLVDNDDNLQVLVKSEND